MKIFCIIILQISTYSSQLNTIISQYLENPLSIRIVRDYEVDNVSKKVIRIILSYIDYINRTVWKK